MTQQRVAALTAVVVALAAVTLFVVWRTSSSPEGASDEETTELHLTSASRGPEGTRDIDEVPEEIPVALVPDSGFDQAATVSRSGEFWNASVTFHIDADLESFAREMDGRIRSDGFVLRQRIIETHRTVAIYDSDDGAVLTVNYRPEGNAVRIRAVLVGA